MDTTHKSLSEGLLQTLQAARSQDSANRQLSREGAGLDEDFDDTNDIEVEVKEKESKFKEDSETDIAEDFKRARNVTYACQELMIEMLGDAAKLAISTENPRAFDIVNNIVTNVRGLNRDLLDFNKAAIEAKGKSNPQNTGDGESGTHVSIDENGAVSVTQTRRTSTVSLLEKIEAARKAKNGDMGAIDNADIIEAEVEEEDNGESGEES